MWADRQKGARVAGTLARLAQLSTDTFYNPYQVFDWPAEVPAGQFWMSPELISLYGTPDMERLSPAELLGLSRWESINFYSANVHGIRDLLLAVLRRTYHADFEPYSDYFSHFIGEENAHMWFFAQFCLRYGGKIYKNKNLPFGRPAPPDIQDFITFAQILIFEDIGHFYNARLKDDERLPPIVRQLNRVHYEDEARHIAMGRELVAGCHERLREKYPADALRQVEDYVCRYVKLSIESYYNPEAYVDAGLDEPYRLRERVLRHPARRQHHRTVLRRLIKFFEGDLSFQQRLFDDAAH